MIKPQSDLPVCEWRVNDPDFHKPGCFKAFLKGIKKGLKKYARTHNN